MNLNFLILFLGWIAATADAVMVCYFGSWAFYRGGHGHFDVETIDPHLCTHVVYSFVGLDFNTWKVKILDPQNELCPPMGKRCALERFRDLKKVNPNLKTLVAVGGWSQGSYWYSEMAKDASRRSIFTESMMDLLLEYDFDGLDVDWEFPAYRGGALADKQNFVLLLQDLKSALTPHSMILTAAVSQAQPIIDPAYDMPAMSAALDMVFVMAYDYHGSWNPYTHHNAPLYGHPSDQPENHFLSVDYTINYYINGGVPKEKLVLGIPTYGRCYTLADSHHHGFFAPSAGAGTAGPFTQTNGFLGYNEICEISQATGDWTLVRDPLMHEPYIYETNRYNIWCGHDDPVSVKTKAEYAKNKGLLGAFVWSIETDDFGGYCGRKFDLIESIKEGLGMGNPTDPTTTTSTTTIRTTKLPSTTTNHVDTTTQPTIRTTDPSLTTTTTPHSPGTTTTSNPGIDTTTSKTPGVDFECGQGNYYAPYYYDCSKYWWCNAGVAYVQLCSSGLYFDSRNLVCDWPQNADTSECLKPGESTPKPAVTTTSSKPAVTTTSSGAVTTPSITNEPPSVAPTDKPIDCSENGIFFIPAQKCNQYWQCNYGSGVLFSCPGDLLWNQAVNICDWPQNVDTSNCDLS